MLRNKIGPCAEVGLWCKKLGVDHGCARLIMAAVQYGRQVTLGTAKVLAGEASH
jgi:hypothetical protein